MAVLETVARVKPKKNDTKEEKLIYASIALCPVGAKRRGGPGGLNKVCGVSPELQAIVGEPAMPRTEHLCIGDTRDACTQSLFPAVMMSDKVDCLHGQSIAMIVIGVLFSLIIIVLGWGCVLPRVIIVNFGGTFVKRHHCAFGLASCMLHTWKANITLAWWKDVIMIILLFILAISLIFLVLLLLFHSYLILTNQTTYELVRRRRIPYLRGIPERVHLFSNGVFRNIYNFCCVRTSLYNLERLPTAQELEEKLRPYTCLDFLTCRCCC